MASSAETDFNTLHFEKKLSGLKDSQDSINKCCHWCLENRQHHKKIVSSWLSVLKRVKIEHRLTLFYLANDVIQYSKRRNYDFVESWSTSLQKATTMVRDEKIKHKILRIFKIWEQRGVYGEEFIADLCGLISVSPAARKNDEPHEFQSSYLITKIRNCAKLETDTDNKLKKMKEVYPKELDGESLCASLKHRAHVDDVEKEVDDYIKGIESYLNALKVEIKARNHLVTLLTQAETQLNNDKKDVKLVANAYKTFASRVKHLKKKLEEMKPTLSSPIPSPDVNAPSPSPDSDIELPVTESTTIANYTQFSNPGFYTPVTNSESAPFTNNGFSSFMGNMPFDIDSINSTLFGNGNSQSNTKPATTHTTYSYDSNNTNSNLFTSQNAPPQTASTQSVNNDYSYTSQVPLLPPPLPPFTKSDNYDVGATYNDSYSTTDSNYRNTSYDSISNPYEPPTTQYQPVADYQSNNITTFPPSSSYPLPVPVPDYPPTQSNYDTTYTTPSVTQYNPNEEYNPEEELETWEPEPTWDQPPTDLETPESPPIFEKKSFNAPIEYHDNQTHGTGVDVDHRVLPILTPQKITTDTDHGHRKKDVDHRNLISLTGSPKETSPKSWNNKDQDYRVIPSTTEDLEDKDYRMSFNLDNLNLPPPPPPPPPNQILIKPLNNNKKPHQHKKLQDNVESIDMDLSDDDNLDPNKAEEVNENLTVVPLKDVSGTNTLEPPPPFPDIPDDVDANMTDDTEMSRKDWSQRNSLPNMDHFVNPNERSWNTTPDRVVWNSAPERSPWKDSHYKANSVDRISNRGFIHRNSMEFRGRGRGNNWNFRGGGLFRGGMSLRGAPRPYVRRGARNFPRGNFRGGY